MENKQRAIQFLEMIVKGDISQAYAMHVNLAMRHHNAYHFGDARSLQQGMEENHVQFPHKKFSIKHIVEEGDIVMTHSHVILEPNKELAVCHVFRFSDHKIVELWDIGQLIPEDAKNNMF